MPPINFGRSSRPGKYEQIAGGRLTNAYHERQGETGKGADPVYAVPGLTRWDNGNYTGAVRGLLSEPDHGLFAVLGSQLVKFTSPTIHSVVGGISGTGPVYIHSNMRTDPEVSILTDDGVRYIFDTSDETLSQMDDGAIATFNSQTYLDEYFVYSSNTPRKGRMYHTGLNDGTDINALAYATAQSNPDKLISIFAHRGAIIALGAKSTEIWENVGIIPFAFDPIRADIDIGCMNAHTVAEVDNGLAWVDQDGVVRHMQGSNPTPISTHDVVRAINDLNDTERQDMRAIVYNFEGHEFYSLTSPKFTWEWDAATGEWHERKTLGQDNWFVNEHVFFKGKEIVGGPDDGKLYFIDPDSDLDGASDILWTAISPVAHAFPNHLSFSSVEIDAIAAPGVQLDPQAKLMFSYSDDAGHTWSNERTYSFTGEAHSYRNIKFNGLGRAKEPGRSFKISGYKKSCRGLIAVDPNPKTSRR